ncbi:hypothetical protein CHUAL_009773 [Chamberlinius hualienensis]
MELQRVFLFYLEQVTTLVLSAILTWISVFGRPQAVLQPALSGTRSLGGGLSFETTTTPKPQIPIIRHINRVNNDGSYTFGYESGDGSYRVETRGLDGLIQGRYGYIDEHGVRKEVDYVAGSATGYEPRGAGITVPPRPPPRPPGQQFLDYDDGSGTTTAPVRSRVNAQRQQVRTQSQQQQLPPPQQQLPQLQPQFQAPPPPPPPPPTQAPPPPPTQPQIIITQPQPPPHQFTRTFQAAPSQALPQPAAIEFSRPVATVPARQEFRSQQQQPQTGGASPIEQFLRQQLSTGPQQQPQQQQLF